MINELQIQLQTAREECKKFLSMVEENSLKLHILRDKVLEKIELGEVRQEDTQHRQELASIDFYQQMLKMMHIQVENSCTVMFSCAQVAIDQIEKCDNFGVTKKI